jgi:hypothetical protein
VSYNGGAGGVAAVPSAQERVAMQETHVPPTPAQRAHVQQAVSNPALSAKVNGGHPAIAATPRPGAFNAPGVVGARGAAPLAPHANTGAPAAGHPPGNTNAPGNTNVHPQPAVNTAARPPAKAPPAKAPPKPAHPPKPQPEKKHEEGNKP